ncbi:MAG: endonuclease V [Cyanobacteria bacterium]|nr:endonuclease V [Cyanobacteriota bacterium]
MHARFELPVVTSREEAIELQLTLSEQVLIEPLKHVETVLGLDAAYDETHAWGAAILCDKHGKIIEKATCGPLPNDFPYIHGLLAFREIFALKGAIEKLTQDADCLLVDGHGIWHERDCGLASMLGLLFDLPSVGCAKSPFTPEFTNPEESRGSWTPIQQRSKIVGATVRTRDAVKPIWLSPGHRCDVETSVKLVTELSKSRIPEPLRFADQEARRISKTTSI